MNKLHLPFLKHLVINLVCFQSQVSPPLRGCWKGSNWGHQANTFTHLSHLTAPTLNFWLFFLCLPSARIIVIHSWTWFLDQTQCLIGTRQQLYWLSAAPALRSLLNTDTVVDSGTWIHQGPGTGGTSSLHHYAEDWSHSSWGLPSLWQWNLLSRSSSVNEWMNFKGGHQPSLCGSRVSQ